MTYGNRLRIPDGSTVVMISGNVYSNVKRLYRDEYTGILEKVTTAYQTTFKPRGIPFEIGTRQPFNATQVKDVKDVVKKAKKAETK